LIVTATPQDNARIERASEQARGDATAGRFNVKTASAAMTMTKSGVPFSDRGSVGSVAPTSPTRAGATRGGGLIVTTVSHRGGDEIFAPGGGADTVYRVATGYVRLYKVLQDGRSINLALLGPGEYFSQDLTEDGYATGCIAEAMADAVVELIDRANFDQQISNNPDLAREMIDSQGRQLAGLHTLVEHLLARDTGVRLATTLLQLADGFGSERQDGRVTIGIPITHQGLANMIGSNRVTVTRKLLEFQQSRAVVAEGRNYLTIDPDALREISEVI
jgi:CRP/FNR family transcriptional regulator